MWFYKVVWQYWITVGINSGYAISVNVWALFHFYLKCNFFLFSTLFYNIILICISNIMSKLYHKRFSKHVTKYAVGSFHVISVNIHRSVQPDLRVTKATLFYTLPVYIIVSIGERYTIREQIAIAKTVFKFGKSSCS